MAKPTILPEWASNGTATEIGLGPSAPKKATGYVANEQPTHLVDNWILYHNYKWAEYLDGFEGEPHTWTVANTFTGVTTMPDYTNVRHGVKIVNSHGVLLEDINSAYFGYDHVTGMHSVEDGASGWVAFNIGTPEVGSRVLGVTWRWKSATGSANATVRLYKQVDSGSATLLGTVTATAISATHVQATMTGPSPEEIVTINSNYFLRVEVDNAATRINIGRFSWAYDKIA